MSRSWAPSRRCSLRKGTPAPLSRAGRRGPRRCSYEREPRPSRRYQPFVGSTKSLSGHALGAAGVHEAIYSLLMLNNDFLAESANINEIVEESEGMNILTKRHEGGSTRVMSNSFGFGGTNCCLVFDKYTE